MSTSATVEPTESTLNKAQVQAPSLYEVLPKDLRESLNEEQAEGFKAVAATKTWRRHPVDIRLNLPFLGGYYLTLIAGRESRSPDRRTAHRHHHPLRTIANTFFFMGFGALFAVLVLFAMAMQSAIVEF